MKRITCIVLCAITSAAFSQNIATAPKFRLNTWHADVKAQQTLRFTQEFLDAQSLIRDKYQGQSGSSRAVSTYQLGTAGNMYTILNGTVNRVAANNDLNTIVFIHRSNPAEHNNDLDELGRYRYDVSTDGGMTWQLNFGVLNPNGNQLTLAGRYPNVVIHNPAGNTNPNNAYLSYLGTWLPFDQGGSWDGHFTGAARLDNNPSTFTENIQSPNNSDIFIATGMCNGKSREFWAANFGSEPFTGISGVDENVKNILIFKGVWNPSFNDVDWSLFSTLTPPYDKSFNSGYVLTSSVTVAFDPTGKFGWIGMSADCRDSSRSDAAPVFYSSSDSGATWTGPIILNLNDFTNIQNNLPEGSISATTTYDADMVVDANGSPHLFTVVAGALTDTTILITGLKLYDFTYDVGSSAWEAVLVDSVQTFRGTLAIDEDGAEITEENRPQATLSPDGNKVFVSWLDSDPALSGGDNTIPNFYARGFDITSGLATPTVNFTVGDPNWDGAALFASISPSTLSSAGTYTIPTVFTKLNVSGYGTDPTQFFYVQNIQFTESQFTVDYKCPFVAVNPIGSNPDYAYLGENYNDPGAEAVLTDCIGNVFPPTINGITSNASTAVNSSSRGTYTVTYTYSDVDGNYGAGTRPVTVNTEPDPNFGFQVTGNVVKFTDSTLYDPTAWTWDFDNAGAGSGLQNPTYGGYTANGTYNVCLEARNVFNAAPFSKPVKKVCKDVTLSSVGIHDALLERSFTLFPNPTTGMLSIEISNEGFGRIQVAVLDVVGKEINAVDFGKQNAATRQQLDLSAYPDGVYFIKIQTDLGAIMKRTILRR